MSHSSTPATIAIPIVGGRICSPSIRPTAGYSSWTSSPSRRSHVTALSELGQAQDQYRDPVGGVLGGEPVDDLPGMVHHADGMDLGGPVQPGEDHHPDH